MLLRTQALLAPALRRTGQSLQQAALMLNFLLTQTVIACCVMAGWRFGQDLGLFGQFAVEHGPFSHWQVWVAAAIAIHFMNQSLTRSLAQFKAEQGEEPQQ